MNQTTEFRKIWEQYTEAWKATSSKERDALFQKSLDLNCVYTDPTTQEKGWEGLSAYIAQLQEKIPGVQMVTMYFGAHHDRSIAKWEMRDGNDNVLGDGVSYGEYTPEGKLQSMTGFFEQPS